MSSANVLGHGANAIGRRRFLGRIGAGLGGAAFGGVLADRLGIASSAWAAIAARGRERLTFGALEPLVDLMQATEADALLPLLVAKLRSGTPLGDVVGAAALANARALGGTNYNGYHAMMALVPAMEMSAQMPAPLAALPVLKLAHRNARFVKEAGRSSADALEPVAPAAAAAEGGALVESIRARDLPRAEASLAALAAASREGAFEQLQVCVREDANVHRVVLAWRAFDVLRYAGVENAVTLLRQSVRFCIDEDGQRATRGQATPPIAALVPKLMDEHGLAKRERGRARADEKRLAELVEIFFGGDGATAAQAAAAALAEGIDPEDVGAAISLAATRLLLHDPGRGDEQPGKPRGSVHGASVGVHASDSANAWRHLSRAGGAANAFASLIAGACHTAGQARHVGARPFDAEAPRCELEEPAALLREVEGAVRERDQRRACAATRRWCELGHGAEDLFALLLRFAVSEDGALHSEKYFRTAQEEHASARPADRPLYLVALTRVMASSCGFPAPGCEDARKLLTTG
jgi:hypothetical protein